MKSVGQYVDEARKKAFARQIESIKEEAQKAGFHLVKAETLMDKMDEQNAVKATTFSALKMLATGGKLEVEALQYYAFEKEEVKTAYFQPYNGTMPIPGQHHAVIDGGLACSLMVKKSFFGSKWIGESQELATRFTKTPELKKVTKKLKWKWAIGTGIINLDWTLQIRPLGDGKMHVVLDAGRYGGFTTYKVGFEVFWMCLQALKHANQGTAGSNEKPFMEAATYTDLFFQLQKKD